MIINILGIDGVGKSTHIYRLADDIRKCFKIDTRVMSKSDILDTAKFPEAKFIKVSYETLAVECLPLMKGYGRAMWLLYIYSILLGGYPPQENEVVLMDGYWHKHYGTESALGVNGEWIKQVCSAFPEPDFILLMDIDPEQIIKRQNKKIKPYECGLDLECRPESFVRHQSKVRNYFKDIIKRSNSAILNTEGDVETIYREMRDMVFREVGKKFPQIDAADMVCQTK